MIYPRRRFALVLSLGFFISGLISNSVMSDQNQTNDSGKKDDAISIEKKISEAIAKLTPEDRKHAEAQRFCPMMEYGRLGSMGAPIKLMIEGKPVFVCCKGCVDDAVKGGKATLAKSSKLIEASAVLAKLTPEDRAAAEAQKYCAVAEGSFLGGMGVPIKLSLNGKPVFLCCKGCVSKAQSNPAATLAKVDALKMAGMSSEHGAPDHANHKAGSK